MKYKITYMHEIDQTIQSRVIDVANKAELEDAVMSIPGMILEIEELRVK